jgi:hypothetical protein
MRTAIVASKSYVIKAFCLIVLMSAVFSATGFSQKVIHEDISDNQGERASGENAEEPESVEFDFQRRNSNAGNSHAQELWRLTNKSYEEANKSLYNYAETFDETMDMVKDQLDKWLGNYAEGYNETMGMVHEEMRKYSDTGLPEESFRHSLIPGSRSLPGSRLGEGDYKRFKRSTERDTILGPWELPEAPPPYHKFPQGLQPSF